MQNKLIYIFTFLLFSVTAINAQDFVSIKGKQYKATPVWNFFCDDYAYSGVLKVQIAKTEQGGIIKLAVDSSDKKLNIADRVYIILEDGSFIFCSDKGIRENSDTETVSYYTFTVQEMSKLKLQEIENIRFKIVGKEGLFSSQTGYFTSTNKKTYFDSSDQQKNKIDTKSDIKALYK